VFEDERPGLEGTKIIKQAVLDPSRPPPRWLTAYRTVRAVLHALRDRMTVDEAAHFAAQLPLLLRGVFFDMWHPSGKPDRLRSQEEFFDRVAAELRDLRPVNTRDAVRSVMKTFDLHTTAGKIEDVKSHCRNRSAGFGPKR
jgi:uncharacterized protein (DUF2267 family)